MDSTSNGDNSLVVHNSPQIPYTSAIPGGIFTGKVILIKGVVAEGYGGHRFNVDLCCGQLVQGDHVDDKALHFNPRFDTGGNWFSKADRDIVLNANIGNTWGAEQRCENVFQQGKAFTLRILILRDYFKIAVNGRQLCDFIHRMPIERIKLLYIAGCVELEVVEFQGSNPEVPITETPPSPSAPRPSFNDSDGKLVPITLLKPKAPLVQPILSGGFLPPREIHLIFTPRMNPVHCIVNLMAGEEYLLHIRVDFPGSEEPKGAIVRNSTSRGAWQTEERSMSKFPFIAGITADLHIFAGRDHAKILIDGAQFCHFTYRANGPLNREVNQVTVSGDLIIQKFEFKESNGE